MKSQVSFLLEKLQKEHIPLTEDLLCDIAYDFQEAIAEVLSKKLIQAAQYYQAQSIALAGGVSANTRIKETIQELLKKKNMEIPFFTPIKNLYSTDNGAMIGVAGLLNASK